MSKSFKIVQVDNLDREENEDVVETLNNIISLGLGGTGSKAFIYAVRQYSKHIQIIAELQSKLEKSRYELEEHRRNSRKAAEVILFFQNSSEIEREGYHQRIT